MPDQIFRRCLEYPQVALGEKRYEKLWKSTGKKDIIKEFGSGIFAEMDGIVAIEAKYSLENSENAYPMPSKEWNNILWSHLHAETNGRTGFAMHVAQLGILWEEPEKAPAMHYRMNINTSGVYHVWMLIRHHNGQSDSCYQSLDGELRPLSEQFGKGKLHNYNTVQIYYWCLIFDMELSKGEHVFSIIARKSDFRVDRIYLIRSDELPPADVQWKDSIRLEN